MLARCVAILTFAASSAWAENAPLARVGDVWKYFPGLAEPPGPPGAWQQPGFDDSNWLTGRSGFGSGEAAAFPHSLIPYHSAYLRRQFDVADAAQVKWLTFRVDYCDGFVAYLNGREIARRNLEGAPGTPVPFDRYATNFHYRGNPEELLVDPAVTAGLKPGPNVLAIQVHGVQPNYAAMCLSAELVPNFNRAPYLQNVSSNQAQIIWKTPVPTDTRVLFGPAGALTSESYDASLVTTHVATLTGLAPDTEYHYQVRSAAGVDTVEWPLSSFHTLKPAGPLKFVVIGDAGWNSLPQYEIADAVRRTEADFVLEVGDIVYPTFVGTLSDLRVFSVYQEHMSRTPWFFGLGNHDLLAGVGHYLEAFYLPTNSVPLAVHAAALTSPEHYYSFDHGDAHFTMLFVPFIHQYQLKVGDPQYQWLVQDLAATAKPWKIVLLHVPMASSSLHRFDDMNLNGIYDMPETRDVLMPVLSRAGVQLVVAGHEHGYERFNPREGVHSITSAGGGVPLYGFTESDLASAFYWTRYNFVHVTIAGDQLMAEALGRDGSVFDRLFIQRAPPAPRVYSSAWHSPAETGPFDFQGEPIPALSGQFSNLGRAWVNNDRTHLYVGLEQVMIYDNNNVFLFIESPRVPGVAHLRDIGNGHVDPEEQGADGLDFLSNLSFTNFTPSVGCILGDIQANGQFRSFARTNMSFNIGQGVFQLDTALSDIPGSRLRQFHLSSLGPGPVGRGNAQFIQVAIPLSTLGGAELGDVLRLGAVVGGAEVDMTGQTRFLDSGYLGKSMSGAGLAATALQGIEVRLVDDPDPDTDGDGLSQSRELALGTDPTRPDSDGDGLPDGWEVDHGLSPLSSRAVDGAEGDPDNDGASNWGEWQAQTHPRDSDSALRLAFQFSAPNRLRVSWPGRPGRQYQVQSSDASLRRFQDANLPGAPLSGPDGSLRFEVDVHPEGGSKFYRVRVLAQ